MTTYTFDITPNLINRASEGSLDTSILNGGSLQRTGYVTVYNGANSKVIEPHDNFTFTDTILTGITAFVYNGNQDIH